MLPLDKLSPAAEAALQSGGFAIADIPVAVRLDLDFDGNYGETWLLYDCKAHRVIRLHGDAASIRSDLSDKV